MSNIVNDIIMDNCRESVSRMWVMEGRPDLENDCIAYVYEHVHHENDYPSKQMYELVIEFLSQHCTQAMSTKDYEFARDEHNKKLLSNLKEMRNNAQNGDD